MAPRGATTGIKYFLSNQSLCGSLSLLHPSSHMQRAVGVMNDYLYVRDILSIIHMVLVWFECLSTQLVRIELAKRQAHVLIRQAKYPKEFPEKRARLVILRITFPCFRSAAYALSLGGNKEKEISKYKL